MKFDLNSFHIMVILAPILVLVHCSALEKKQKIKDKKTKKVKI